MVFFLGTPKGALFSGLTFEAAAVEDVTEGLDDLNFGEKKKKKKKKPTAEVVCPPHDHACAGPCKLNASGFPSLFVVVHSQALSCMDVQEGALAEAVGEPVDDEESAALDASLAGKKKKKKKPKVSICM